MATVKISDKGRALLSRSFAASRVVHAIAGDGEALTSRDGLTVTIDGKTIKVQSAAVTGKTVQLLTK